MFLTSYFAGSFYFAGTTTAAMSVRKFRSEMADYSSTFEQH